MSFSLINIDTMFFTGCFDIRVDIHLLCSDFNNQASLFSSPAFSGTQTPFFLPDRPTHHPQRRGDGKQTFYWDGPGDMVLKRRHDSH